MNKYERLLDIVFPLFGSEDDYILTVAFCSLLLGNKVDINNVLSIISKRFGKDGLEKFGDYLNEISKLIHGDMNGAEGSGKRNRRDV